MLHVVCAYTHSSLLPHPHPLVRPDSLLPTESLPCETTHPPSHTTHHRPSIVLVHTGGIVEKSAAKLRPCGRPLGHLNFDLELAPPPISALVLHVALLHEDDTCSSSGVELAAQLRDDGYSHRESVDQRLRRRLLPADSGGGRDLRRLQDGTQQTGAACYCKGELRSPFC